MREIFFLSIVFIKFISPEIAHSQEIIYKYIEAHNSHDVQRELSFYHPEVVFEIENTWTKQGLREMEELARWDSTLYSNLHIEAIEWKNDSLFCNVIENDDWFSAIGIQNVKHERTLFVLKDEKILKIVAHPSEEIAKLISLRMEKLIEWSSTNNDSTIFSLLDNGRFVYSTANAAKWLLLFGKWHPSCDTLYFKSSGLKLKGYFYSSNQKGAPTLLFTQGFMENGDIWGIGKFLSKNGINVFMFDFRGCFESEGKQGLRNSLEDIEAAIKFLKSKDMLKKYKIDLKNIIIGGYSYGGHMSMLYAINHPEIKRVITVSGGDLGIFGDIVQSNPNLRKGYFDFFQSIKKPNGPVDFEYDDPIQELIDNQEYFYILQQVDRLANVDVFLIGGLDDNVVSMENYVLPLYRKLKKNKSINVDSKVYQTEHSYKSVSEELLTDIENWIKENQE